MGVIGSPRKGRLTDKLVSSALNGAASVGAGTTKVYLIDYEIPAYTGEARCPEELNELCERAKALVIGAPVYFGDINGLTKDFMDIVRIPDANGKYGLGIAIAGGTGKGLCLAVQSIYSFFYHRQMRGIDPTPVSRFNFQRALERLDRSGRALAQLVDHRDPFEDLWDRIEHYEQLKYLNYTYLDEIMLLAEQLLEMSAENPAFEEAKREYGEAQSLMQQGNRIQAARHASKSYELLYFPST